jgi:hypothetical protein
MRWVVLGLAEASIGHSPGQIGGGQCLWLRFGSTFDHLGRSRTGQLQPTGKGGAALTTLPNAVKPAPAAIARHASDGYAGINRAAA